MAASFSNDLVGEAGFEPTTFASRHWRVDQVKLFPILQDGGCVEGATDRP